MTQYLSTMLRMYLLCLTLLVTAEVCGAASRAAAGGVREISMTRYLTSATASNPALQYVERLVFRADGTAIYVGSEPWVRRVGRHRGRVSKSDFARMAALLNTGRFFAMSNQYGRRDTRGGTSGYKVVVNALRGSGSGTANRKSVVAWGAYRPRPATLRKLAQVMDGLLWKTKWQPDKRVDEAARGLSGVKGNLHQDVGRTRKALPGALIILRGKNGKVLARARTDHNGNFEFQVPPGRYWLVPPYGVTLRTADLTTAAPFPVQVSAYRFSEMLLLMPRS